MFSKLTIGPLIGLLLLALLAIGVKVPAGITAETLTGVVLIFVAVGTSIARFYHGEALADAKTWWQSRVIWTQLITGIYGALALFNVAPGITPANAVEMALAASSVLGLIFGVATKRPIG